jgi:hypothetical protein
MNNNVVQAAYAPVVKLQYYGMDTDFGEYHKETRELKILDESMFSNADLEKLKQWLNEQNKKGDLCGHTLLIGIPGSIYQMREKVQRGEVSDEIG